MLQKLIREIKFDTSGGAKMKQRLLLMLDEFPQLGNLKSMELALAVCAGYGIKVCIVAQDVNQLNKEYTKDNSIASNCHVHIYFTPNLDSGAATAESISKNLGKKTITTVSHSDGGGLGKGSNSESFTGRELMTPDEVSHMSSERELVFVAGHRPIYGKKLRYYLQPFFTERLRMYQKIYIKEHEYEEECKKYTINGKHDCEKCIEEYKKKNGKPAIVCPIYPLYSDTVTRILSFDELFAVNEAEKVEREEKAKAVQLEKEYQEQEEAKKKEQTESRGKVNLKKEKRKVENEETKATESVKNIDIGAENREGNEVVKNAGTDEKAIAAVDGEVGESEAEGQEVAKENKNVEIEEKSQSAISSEKEEIKNMKNEEAEFGESPLLKEKYEESWLEYINGDRE